MYTDTLDLCYIKRLQIINLRIQYSNVYSTIKHVRMLNIHQIQKQLFIFTYIFASFPHNDGMILRK